MRVAFRVDASAEIGTGHVKRCASLAAALTRLGAKLRLVHRDLGTSLEPLLTDGIFEKSITLPPPKPGLAIESAIAHASWAGVTQCEDAAETVAALGAWRPDWVVVDHYAFDSQWHDAVRGGVECKIAAIDDLGDRALTADLIVDHNLASDHRAKHRISASRSHVLLGGPSYALLDEAYADGPRYAFSAGVRSIGIFMGGVDKPGLSGRVAQLCRKLGFTGLIEIAATSLNPQLELLVAQARKDKNLQILIDAPNLSNFFALHDLQIGAGGGATWERCCIGPPTIALACAENQRMVLEPLQDKGVLVVAHAEDPDLPDLAKAISSMIARPDMRMALSRRAQALVDGAGCRRVAERMAQL